MCRSMLSDPSAADTVTFSTTCRYFATITGCAAVRVVTCKAHTVHGPQNNSTLPVSALALSDPLAAAPAAHASSAAQPWAAPCPHTFLFSSMLHQCMVERHGGASISGRGRCWRNEAAKNGQDLCRIIDIEGRLAGLLAHSAGKHLRMSLLVKPEHNATHLNFSSQVWGDRAALPCAQGIGMPCAVRKHCTSATAPDSQHKWVPYEKTMLSQHGLCNTTGPCRPFSAHDLSLQELALLRHCSPH